MADLRVVQTERVVRVEYVERVLLETDDPLEAHAYVMDHRADLPVEQWPRVQAPHPSHQWERQGKDTRCVRCDAWNNGSYGSHFPCGYDFGGRSLFSVVQEWRQARAGAESSDTEPVHP